MDVFFTLLGACGLTEADQSCKYFLIIPLFVSLSSGVIQFTDANLLKMRPRKNYHPNTSITIDDD